MTATALPDVPSEVVGPDPDTVEQIVGDIFVGLLGEGAARPVPRAAAPAVPGAGSDAEITASVSVTGAWAGHVVIRCSTALARALAGRLFLVPEDEVVEAEICDAVGELVNVVGGNVKAMMPGPSVLTLPRVTVHGAAEHLPGAVETLRLELSWCSEPLTISSWSAPFPSSPHQEFR